MGMFNISELMIYRNFEKGEILEDVRDLYEAAERGESVDKESFYGFVNRLLEFSETHGFEGNLWHMYLTYLLANNENAYSMACEITGPVSGSINDIVTRDFEIFMGLFRLDLRKMEAYYGADCLSALENYSVADVEGNVYNTRIRDRIHELSISLAKAESAEEFKDTLTEFYKEFGVGKFGLHKAFRVEHGRHGVKIVPIKKISHVSLDDLVGYDIPKGKLIANTEAFVNKRKANNCILFGDAGTGKSSSCKAILNRYYDDGLRMIEVYKHQFQDLNDVIAQIKNRNYRFIIYMDDLSFEDYEIEYKYLKAVIEGGLERKPDNVLIYATSNRRHLIREQYSDKEGRRDDLHASDTVQEKLSLASRFGISIFFNGPDKKQFDNIVLELAARNGIEMDREQLLLEANKWEINHGGMSGRTAQQFIDYLLGKE